MKQGHMIVGEYRGGLFRTGEFLDATSGRVVQRRSIEHTVEVYDEPTGSVQQHQISERLPDTARKETVTLPKLRGTIVMVMISGVFGGKNGRVYLQTDQTIQEVQ